ncbi:MAG: PilZ domain-containing protein [Candidatus Angelobacter sp.]
MSSTIRSNRSRLRRKMVLPVTVIRNNGQEQQLAHTLDLTHVSARLGGVSLALKPGEIIEIQCGAIKARFQVFWIGAPGSAMEGQAGVRSMEPTKDIWGDNLPPDETDVAPKDRGLRRASPPTLDLKSDTEKRWHTRFECRGSASVRGENSGYPVRGEVKDIALGGVYVETTIPLPVNTRVYVKMNVEDIPIEAAGVVRTSYPMVGMGISLQDVSPEQQEKLEQIIQRLRLKSSSPKNLTEPAFETPVAPKVQAGSPAVALRLDDYPASVLAKACRMLAADFDEWKTARSTADLTDLRLAVIELQQKLAVPPQIELLNQFSSTVPQVGHV